MKEDEEDKTVEDDSDNAKNWVAHPASVQRMIRYLFFMVGSIVSTCRRNQDSEKEKYDFHVNCSRINFILTLTVGGRAHSVKIGGLRQKNCTMVFMKNIKWHMFDKVILGVFEIF